MKTYRELNVDEKHKLEELINEVVSLLPEGNTFFASEKNSFLKTKQDYDTDKNDILRIIEEKRKEGLIDKEKAKELRLAVTTLFNEFIRISPKKTIDIPKQEEKPPVEEKDRQESQMTEGELYIKIQDTYVKIPEKVMYRIIDIPGNADKQTMQYYIVDEKENEKTL